MFENARKQVFVILPLFRINNTLMSTVWPSLSQAEYYLPKYFNDELRVFFEFPTQKMLTDARILEFGAPFTENMEKVIVYLKNLWTQSLEATLCMKGYYYKNL